MSDPEFCIFILHSHFAFLTRRSAAAPAAAATPACYARKGSQKREWRIRPGTDERMQNAEQGMKMQNVGSGILHFHFAFSFCISPPSISGGACGRCDACLLRKKGFAEAGVADPTRYG